MPPTKDHDIVRPGPWIQVNTHLMPTEAIEHILLRLKQRVYRPADVTRFKMWTHSENPNDLLVPQQSWFKSFGTFYVVGNRDRISSALDMGMPHWGIPLYDGIRPMEAYMRQKYPEGLPVYHEAPADKVDVIKKQGLGGESNAIGKIDQGSGGFTFNNTVEVKFVIPWAFYRYVFPGPEFVDDNALLTKHPTLKGADISFARPIPPSWIRKIEKLGFLSRLISNRKASLAARLSHTT